MSSRFTGLIAAPFTAFHADGSLNLARIIDQAQVLLDTQVKGAFVCGTTGEGTSLTTAERKAVAEQWISVAKGRLKIIVHAGHASVAEAKELAAHAQHIGADAVATTPPFYFKPANVPDLVGFLSEVASAAPKLPFYYYDIPSTTGVTLPSPQVLRQLSTKIPNLAGVKFSNPDLLALQECTMLDDGKHDVFFGVDEFLLSAVVLGATGAVGSTYCYAAPVYHKMLAAVNAGKLAEARAFQNESAKLVRALIDFGGLRAGKAIMKFIGVDCGPLRSPLRALSTEEEREFFERLKHLDIFARPLVLPGS